MPATAVHDPVAARPETLVEPAIVSATPSRKGVSFEEKRRRTMAQVQERLEQAHNQWNSARRRRPGQDMGTIERRLSQGGREIQRAELERLLQEEASDTPDNCPECGAPLSSRKWRKIRIVSIHGPVEVSRTYGYCKKCKKWFAPADRVLGIDKAGTSSPELAERLGLLGTILPPENVERLSEKICGFPVSHSRVARDLERCGREALEQREKEDKRALSTQGRHEIAAEIAKDLPDELTMIIQADAFMCRERDDWGRTAELLARGVKPERWHEIKAGTIFLLSDRVETGQTQSRATILRRSYVATRAEAYEFGQKLYAQAVRDGLLKAKAVYFIADGGVWLWHLREHRFREAQGVLDFFHASQHIWEVAHAQYGKDSDEARQWAEPLLHQLRHGGEAGVLESLEQLATIVEEIAPANRSEDQKTIARGWRYFLDHIDHIKYDELAANGIPIGSGCIESTCKQYQLRTKRSGQFWSTKNLEGLLCLYSRWLTNRLN